MTTTAFLRVVRQPGWRDLDTLDRYLLRAVRNEAQNLYRQRRRRWERDLAGMRPAIADDVLINVDVFAAVAAFSVRQRAVVYLAYWEDRTEADIADLLGLSRGSVHRTLSRARAALRKELE